jgi:nucleoside-diphosphate-sugar epimerase
MAEITAVQELLATIRPDVIFHLAGHAAGARDPKLVIPTFRDNLVSTVNLLTVVQEVGCARVLLPSSLEEPEPGDPQAIPSSPYAASKWACSAYARMFHTLYGLPVVLVRVLMGYGPGQKDSKLIPYVILSLLRGESPKLSSGERPTDWIYIDDIVEAFVVAAQANGVEGQRIDAGSGVLVPIRMVVDHLVQLINPQIEPLYGALPDRPFEQVRVADTARTQAMIGWKPTISLEEGLKRTVNWHEKRLKKNTP